MECQHCSKVHSVDADEDGGAAIELWPCQGAVGCTEMLCDAEDCRKQCAVCDCYTCAEHLVDGECEICRAEAAKEEK